MAYDALFLFPKLFQMLAGRISKHFACDRDRKPFTIWVADYDGLAKFAL